MNTNLEDNKNESGISYDSKGYKDTLEKLVTMSEKEYYVHLVDINRHQVVVARNLLWLCVVILGFNFASIDWFSSKTQLLNILTPSYVLLSLSTVLGLISFALAGISIPAFGDYDALYKDSWSEYACYAHTKLFEGAEDVYTETLNELLNKIDKASHRGSKTNGKRGLLLRFSSILIMVSACLLCLGYLFFLFKFYM